MPDVLAAIMKMAIVTDLSPALLAFSDTQEA
jgi:hypothetical protein